MTTQETINISVIDPISPAFEKVKTILFKPFDLGKWFVIGFCVWLAYLGKGGGGGGSNFGMGPHPGEELEPAKDFILQNLPWILPLAIFGVAAGIAIWLLITWLSSRGQFMFLHCVSQNKAEVKVPWARFRQHGNSLFLFRIVVGLLAFAAIGLPLIIIVLLIIALFSGHAPHAAPILGLVVAGLAAFVIAVGIWLLYKFTMDFVVPIMFLRTTSCTAAWRELLTLLSSHKAQFVLYILFQIVIAITIGAIILAAILATCCCAACILAIPYVGTVLMLPVLIFKRAYSLCYLQQFGPEFDVFSSEVETVSAAR